MENAFPFHFKIGEIYPDDLKKFIVHCQRHNASDFTIQGGDYIWVERYGRQIQGSATTLTDTHLRTLISDTWSADIVPLVLGGNDQDRALAVSGEQFALERGETVRLRTNFIQANVGNNITITATSRIIPGELPTLEKYPIEEEFLRDLFARDGLNIMGGPTGSGKTTSLTACYLEVGRTMPDRKLITYEDPIEFILGGPHWKGLKPSQSEVGRDIPSFAAGIRNALRRAPKIIGVGEARDLETYSAGIEAAKSGHLVFFTLHIDQVGEVFSRITQAFPVQQQASIAFDLLSKLNVVMVQNLFNSTDGKRVMVREGLVFNQDIKKQLEKIPYPEWSRWVENHMRARKATIADKLWHLYKAGKVDKKEVISKLRYDEYVKFSQQNEVGL